MPRKDFYHEIVRLALEKDHWTITDDPLELTIGGVELYADLGAERLIAAEKGTEKIAIEIKSFISESPVSDFHKALGQYESYKLSLSEIDPNRQVWLAIPHEAWKNFFQRPFIQKAISHYGISLVIFDLVNIQLEKWIN